MKTTFAPALPSLSRTRAPERACVTVAALQFAWKADTQLHAKQIEDAVKTAKAKGAEVIFLPELTLRRYPADVCPTSAPNATAEDLTTGPTGQLFARLAKENQIIVHGSLFEYQDFADGRGLNTAVIFDANGILSGKTPKLHIPVTEGYFEDKYFQPGPNSNPYPTYELQLSGKPKVGLPTCWDEWFPEVARAYGLAGADILCYPTAIGSEPDHPEFDTEPLWRAVIVSHAIANGLFIVVPNRYGNEGILNFYGSSFIVDPYGRILAQASRDQDELLIAELDLDQRRDWLELFPFFATRRPETYTSLTQAVVNPRTNSGQGEAGGIPGLRP
jgi:N-carbamoylputrescine amidase